MPINSKLPHVGTTIFTVMSALAKEHGAINLSQGFPDFDCNHKLQELATHYIKNGNNQYAPMQGVPVLRETIAEIIKECYGAIYNPDTEITITAGATQAIYTAVTALLGLNEEAIIFEPAYDCYKPAIELQGAKAVSIAMEGADFSINWDKVKNKINEKTKIIIINSPHNPSGSVLNETDLKTLEKLISGKNIWVISDEVYEHMAFENPHQSITRFPELRKKSILVSSFGKTVHTTGWKIGYVAAPDYLMAEFRKVHQFLVFAVNHPLQLALADFLADKKNYLELSSFYKNKRDYFRKLIQGSRFELLPCRGTYFQLVSFNKISNQADTDFAKELTIKHKVAAIPLSVFYENEKQERLLRFCFAKKDETLEKAAEILCKI